jgi:hypothetical protein
MSAGLKWACIAMVSTISLAVSTDESFAGRGRGRSGWTIGVGPGGVYGGYTQGGWYGNPGWYGSGGWYGNRGWYGNPGWYGGRYYGSNYYYPNYGYSSGYYYYPSYSYGGQIYSNTPSYQSGSSIATNSPPMRTGSGGDVVIMNSQENGTALNYSLNGQHYTIQPGQTQRVSNDRQWIVEFDRGSGEGSARYTLNEGKFKFKSTENGWELVRIADQDATSRTTAKPPLDTINEPPPRTFDDEEPQRSQRESDRDRELDDRDEAPRSDSLEAAPEPQ